MTSNKRETYLIYLIYLVYVINDYVVGKTWVCVCVCVRARARVYARLGRGRGSLKHIVVEFSLNIRTTCNILAAITDIRVNLTIHI